LTLIVAGIVLEETLPEVRCKKLSTSTKISAGTEQDLENLAVDLVITGGAVNTKEQDVFSAAKKQ
jgi:hypothetical protein